MAIRFNQVGRVFLQDRMHRLERGIAPKGPLAREHLVQDCSEGKNVGPVVCRLAAHLFGRHIARRAQNRSRVRAACHGRRTGGFYRDFGAGELGQAEIKDLDPPVFCDEEIFRLEVAVDDALVMCSGKTARGKSTTLGSGNSGTESKIAGSSRLLMPGL